MNTKKTNKTNIHSTKGTWTLWMWMSIALMILMHCMSSSFALQFHPVDLRLEKKTLNHFILLLVWDSFFLFVRFSLWFLSVCLVVALQDVEDEDEDEDEAKAKAKVKWNEAAAFASSLICSCFSLCFLLFRFRFIRIAIWFYFIHSFIWFPFSIHFIAAISFKLSTEHQVKRTSFSLVL